MIYMKSFLTGLAALVLAALLGIGATVAIAKRYSSEGIGATVAPGWSIATILLLAFVIGFFWRFRRPI
jgi:uncharacterized membrane protein YqgA involved in biofilm formation